MLDVLVTGATGLVGNNVCRALLARGHRVRVLIRGSASQPALAGLALTVHPGDLLDPAAVTKAARGVDAIIHCAAHVHIGWSQSKVHQQVNVEGTRSILRAAERERAKLVSVSSVNALGISRDEQPADETSAVWEIVRCPYSESKRQADQLVRSAMAGGLAATLIYPTLMFGPWDWKPSSGKMILEVTRSQPFAAPAGGVNVADARDVAAAMVNILEHPAAGREFILGGHNLSYFELWKKLGALVQSSRPWMAMRPLMAVMVGYGSDALSRWQSRELSTNSAAMRMSCQRHWFSSARAERELGYHARPLDETLRDAYAFLTRPPAPRRAA